MTIMVTPAGIRVETMTFGERDKIVRRLDEFPELNTALRTGDVGRGRILCAQLFNSETCQGRPLVLLAKAS
jgi:hypothetical protein